jgi:SAM-dependent methyltransferase
VADWYAGWVGAKGSEHHRRLVMPALLGLLAPQPGEQILEIGCGPGVLARRVATAGALYTGVDASPRLLQIARRHQGQHGRFLLGDATRLAMTTGLAVGSFDAVVFMLSIQDMHPLDPVLASTAWSLRRGGRVVVLMTHPCFRVPRQSGWGWDRDRKLAFRRVDRYLTPLAVPMKVYGSRPQDATRSFHRPLEAYFNGLSAHGLLVDYVRELPGFEPRPTGDRAAAEHLANDEIPLFLALRARKGG